MITINTNHQYLSTTMTLCKHRVRFTCFVQYFGIFAVHHNSWASFYMCEQSCYENGGNCHPLCPWNLENFGTWYHRLLCMAHGVVAECWCAREDVLMALESTRVCDVTGAPMLGSASPRCVWEQPKIFIRRVARCYTTICIGEHCSVTGSSWSAYPPARCVWEQAKIFIRRVATCRCSPRASPCRWGPPQLLHLLSRL